MNVGDQYATAWLHQAVRKAAKYGLMVDIHDEYRSTGYSRTYPNLLTQESIRGDEESPSLDQAIYTLYNRMICGAGDYTNCYFAERVTEKMGGRAAQLAKLVAIYSPWQFVYWYDRPEKSPETRRWCRLCRVCDQKQMLQPVSIILFRPYGTKLASWREKWGENMLWSPAVRVPIGM